MTETKTVEVTQADREAAAVLWETIRRCSWAEWQDEWFRDGTGDFGPLVQTFARHRLASQSLSSPTEVEREALAAFTDLMSFDLMAKWTREGRQDFRDVVARAKATAAALEGKDHSHV